MVTLLVVATSPLVNPFWSGSSYTIALLASLGVVVTALRTDQGWTGLTSPVLGWLGERSYSLYLVHVPVFMVSNEVLNSAHPALRVSAAVGLSGILAVILYQYVERPFRRSRRSMATAEHGATPRTEPELNWARAG